MITRIEKLAQIERAIQLYVEEKMPIMKASAIANIGSATLQIHLKKRGLTRSNKQNSRKYTLNEYYFQDINTTDKAYWLGFMYADGFLSLSKHYNQKNVGISLHEKHASHLNSFKTTISATYPIKHYQSVSYGVLVDYVKLLVTSDKMFDDLKKQGCFEHKSLNLIFPNEQQVPKFLMSNFIRGYFDGDGSFSKSHDGYQLKICGTQEFLRKLLEQIGFSNQKIYKRYKDGKNHYYCSIGGKKQVSQIGGYFYENATIFLERKHKRYLKLIS